MNIESQSELPHEDINGTRPEKKRWPAALAQELEIVVDAAVGVLPEAHLISLHRVIARLNEQAISGPRQMQMGEMDTPVG